MLWLSRLFLRLQSVFRRKKLEEELSQEVAFHLEQQKAEYLSLGMSDVEAEAAARRLFGPELTVKEQCRDQRRTGWIEDFVQDTRFALRSFSKTPSFTVVTVLTLALGIGANTAFFSTAYGILFRPLPYPDSSRLVDVVDGISAVGPVTALREMSHAVDYAGYFPNNDFNLQLGGQASRVRASAVTWNLARVLRVAPAQGRWFTQANERPGQHRVVVLSDHTWRVRFGADPAIVGRRVLLDEEPFEITGVMPADFAFPSPDTELWIPVRLDPRNVGYMWGGGNLWPIGRLRDRVTLVAAQAEVGPLIDRIRRLFPWRMPDEYGRGARVIAYSESVAKSVRLKLFALSMAALLLLLIACANVANLLLARAVQREREFAMREALGARRLRLLRQLIAENFVLVVAGGMAGLLIATLILKALPVLLPKDTPRLHEIVADPVLVSVAVGSMFLTIILFGAMPLLKLWRVRREVLVGRATTASKQASGTSLSLIAIELALATVLLVGAALMGRTLWVLAHADSGVHSTGIVTARISAGPGRCGTPARCWAWLQAVNQTILEMSGVRSVNWSNFAPLEKEFSAVAVDVQDHPKPPGAPAFVVWQTVATPGYFSALGIPLLAGRFFTEADRKGALPVILISDSTAKRFWKNESPIGKRIRPMSALEEWRTVVGVVGDVAQYSLTGFPPWVDGLQYVPLAQNLPIVAQNIQLTMMVQSLAPQATILTLPSAIQQRFSDVVVSRTAPLEGIRSESILDQRSTAWLLALVAVLGLVLGIIGIHGVISHRAAQRRREIGIRIAMGATTGAIVRMILQEALLVSLVGCMTGVILAFGLSRFLQSLVFGITRHDTVAFGVFPAILLATALLAAAIPGWRAAKADPAITLRQDQ